MAISAFRGSRLPLLHPPQLPAVRGVPSGLRKFNYRSKRFTLLAQYSQTQDLFSSRLQNSIENLPKLVEDIVQTSINTGPRGAIRLAQGIQAFVGVGSEWLADVSKSRSSTSGLPTELQLGLLSPLYLRRLFERMGATYIKLGQVRVFIASSPTLFPPEYVEEFQNCFDRTPAVPFEEIKRTLLEDLGRPIESVYEYVDPTPIASASVAQVHGARLRGSQDDVVIKVLKPGIEDILVADLNFVYVVARILEFLNPELSRTSLVGIVKDIRESMLEEVDFRKEAANIESFRRYLEAMGLTRQATAPKVYHHCSTRRVLTMERLYGVPLTDLDSISSLVSSPENSLITALNVWFGSLLACETFHADVHAGNLWLLRDGRIGFLDFELVVATARGTTTNTTAVSANIVVDERQMNALFLDLLQVSESYGLKFPREFALLLKQLLYFDRNRWRQEMDDSYFTRLTRADGNIFATQVGLLVEISVLSEMHALHLNIACERVHNSCPTVMLIYRLSLFQLMIMFSDECWGDV
ncbi:putative aarF domain-containing protein kinase [Citrus sinensis]|uniref:AarF domain-containing protein kinase n=1 Tax=Citrus sinensis TaxID=2711 RepID=A0ACB8L2W1_CITSI|nr:putative aarF domain-containing protein kinase [Citrus sinensis]